MFERTIFGLALMTVTAALLIFYALKKNEESLLTFLSGAIGGCAFILALFLIIMPVKPTNVYVPAEIACKNELSTYFHDVETGHIYHVETKPSYEDNCPYLLDIETHGTESKLDDEVLVVWRTD